MSEFMITMSFLKQNYVIEWGSNNRYEKIYFYVFIFLQVKISSNMKYVDLSETSVANSILTEKI